jgi:hypothetical protein
LLRMLKIPSCRYWPFVLLRSDQIISHLFLYYLNICIKFLSSLYIWTLTHHPLNYWKIISYSWWFCHHSDNCFYWCSHMCQILLLFPEQWICIKNIFICQYHQGFSLSVPIAVSKYQALINVRSLIHSELIV